MLIYAIIFINLALLFYTIGVWGEKLQGKLKTWHLALFYVGLICDTTGTLIMESLSKNSVQTSSSFFHGITGVIAILLMLVHAIWATIVLIRKKDDMIIKFHKFSVFVWIIWLIPFISGALFHMI